MNVLMLYPRFPEETFWNYVRAWKPISRWKASMPPLGLLTVASYLPADFNVRLIDRTIAEETPADWAWADVVFLSAMIGQWDDYRRCVDAARRHGKPLAVGGPLTHALPEVVTADAEWVCFGEAEDIMDVFISDLRAGVRGRQYQGGNKTDMTTVRLPRFDLLPRINDYLSIPIQFSRGCPFQCEFCDIIEIYGRVPRTKTPDQILNELNTLRASGFRGAVFMVDDNFIGNKKKAKLMLHALGGWCRDHGYPFRFWTEASINLADDDELLEAMAQANFVNVFIGIETPDPRLLKTTLKFQNIAGDPLQKLQHIREFGIDIMAGFIVGFDGEPRDVYETQRRFIEASAVAVAHLSLLQAVPHTGLARRLEKEGRLLGRLMPQHETSHGTLFVPNINFIPSGALTKRQYLAGYAKTLCTLYAPDAYFARILPGLLSLRYRVPPRAFFAVCAAFFPTFLRQMYRLGIRSSVFRKHYWRVLLPLLFRNPRALEAFAFDAGYFEHLTLYIRHVSDEVAQYLAAPSADDVLDQIAVPTA